MSGFASPDGPRAVERAVDPRFEVMAFATERALAAAEGCEPLAGATEAIERALARRCGWAVAIQWGDPRGHRPSPYVTTVPIRHAETAVGVLVVAEPVRLEGADLAFSVALAAQLAAMWAAADTASRRPAADISEMIAARTGVGIAAVGEDDLVVWVNDAFCSLVGRRRDDLVGSDWSRMAIGRHSAIAGASLDQDVVGELVAVDRPDGTVAWARVDVSSPAGHGRASDRIRIVHAVTAPDPLGPGACTCSGASGRVDADELLSIGLSSTELVVRLGMAGHILDANDAALTAFGLSAEAAVGTHVRDLLAAEVADQVVAEIAAVTSMGQPRELWRQWVEFDQRAPGWFVLRVLPGPVDDQGYIEQAYLVASDISELVESERRFATMAHTDPLTGLANRAAFVDHATKVIGGLSPDGGGTGVAVALIDLDDFKFVNDRFGHAAGDEALVAVAAALRSTAGPGDLVGRLGGDEFVAVITEVGEATDGGEATEQIRRRLAGAIRASHIVLDDGTQFWLSGSVGVASTDRVQSLDDLLAAADRAMYESKARRRNTVALIDGASGHVSAG